MTSKIRMQGNFLISLETVKTIVRFRRSIRTISQFHRKSTSGTIFREDLKNLLEAEGTVEKTAKCMQWSKIGRKYIS